MNAPAIPRAAGSRRGRIGWVVALLVLAALFVVAVSHLDLGRAVEEIARARIAWIVTALVAYALILPLWAWQWTLLAPPSATTRFRRMIGVTCMTSTVLNTTPFLVGEAAGVFFLVTWAEVARGAAVAVLAMDQVLVGIAKLVVLSSAAMLLPLPLWMTRGIDALLIAVGALLVALLVCAWGGDATERWLARRTPALAQRIYSALRGGLAPLRSVRRGGGALGIAVLKKATELAAIVAIQHAFGVTLHPSSALLVLAALNLATLLPVVPGNAGVYEAAVVVAYVQLGVPAEQALGMAVVQHACYFVALALPGYRWLALLRSARSEVAAS